MRPRKSCFRLGAITGSCRVRPSCHARATSTSFHHRPLICAPLPAAFHWRRLNDDLLQATEESLYSPPPPWRSGTLERARLRGEVRVSVCRTSPAHALPPTTVSSLLSSHLPTIPSSQPPRGGQDECTLFDAFQPRSSTIQLALRQSNMTIRPTAAVLAARK